MDVRRQGQPNERMAPEPAAPAPSRAKKGGSLYQTALVLVVVVAVVALLGVVWHVVSALTADSAINSKEYQALFLTNGQVYFGKLSNVDSGYVKLTDIFYLQVQQQVQPSSSSSSSQSPQVSLAKLGGELHGPEDVMYVAHQQVLFWENLKPSGKVSQAITSYKAGGK
jgi:hypothetical protein